MLTTIPHFKIQLFGNPKNKKTNTPLTWECFCRRGDWWFMAQHNRNQDCPNCLDPTLFYSLWLLWARLFSFLPEVSVEPAAQRRRGAGAAARSKPHTSPQPPGFSCCTSPGLCEHREVWQVQPSLCCWDQPPKPPSWHREGVPVGQGTGTALAQSTGNHSSQEVNRDYFKTTSQGLTGKSCPSVPPICNYLLATAATSKWSWRGLLFFHLSWKFSPMAETGPN